MISETAITRARTRTSHDKDGQVSIAQFVEVLQGAQDRLRALLARYAPTLYNTTASYTISGATVTMAKPSDFYSLVRFEKLYGARYFPIWVCAGLDTSGIRHRIEFREEATNFVVEPVEEAPGTYRATYITNPVTLVQTPKAVRLACAAALPAYTAAGAGIGATLTMNATGVVTVDGSAVALNDRIFLPDTLAAAADQAGIYKCTTAGAIGVAGVFTRATDFDEPLPTEVEVGVSIRPSAGTDNVGKTYVLTTSVPITLDTTELAFTTYASTAATDTVEIPRELDDCLIELLCAKVRERCEEDPSAHMKHFDDQWRETLPLVKRRYGFHAVSAFHRLRGDV